MATPKMTNEEYVDKNGLRCPFCEGNNTHSLGGPELMDHSVDLDMTCDDCGEEWTEEYKLSGYRV